MPHIFHIHEELAGTTLSAALRKLLEGKPWRGVKGFIAGRHVQVNGNLCLDEGRRLKSGDVVQFWEQPLARPVDQGDVRIVHLDEHLVVVSKPAGMTTLRHPEERNWPARRKQLQPTLEEVLPKLLAQHLGQRVSEAKPPQSRPKDRRRGRPGKEASQMPLVRAVHRLDRDTSGLLVFARTLAIEPKLVRLFSKHQIERAYAAVVQGRVAAQTRETWLVRDRGDGLRGSSPLGKEAPDAQRAITHIQPLEVFAVGGQTYSLIECRLETGRTHQIRIHLAELGHMLCGEKIYTHAVGEKPRPDASAAPRQALHAALLAFTHPITGKLLRFTDKLPADLVYWLSVLRA